MGNDRIVKLFRVNKHEEKNVMVDLRTDGATAVSQNGIRISHIFDNDTGNLYDF